MNPFHEGAAGKYFVGRDDQLRRFTRALTALRNAEPAHLYVAGVNGRGKTSYLEKLVEMARQSGILAVRVALDGAVRAQQQIPAMFEKLLRKIDEIHVEKVGAPRLIAEWKQLSGSPFHLPGSERLQNDHLLQDLGRFQAVDASAASNSIVLSFSEGLSQSSVCRGRPLSSKPDNYRLRSVLRNSSARECSALVIFGRVSCAVAAPAD
ncbi:MAG: ATP-binding protein, partial [Pseudonocardiaceae bacterium]